MRLCDWFAGIDISDRDVIAAIGASQSGSDVWLHGIRSFAAENDFERDHALREIAEWLRLESGGNLSSVAFTVPGNAYRSLASRGECRYSEPVVVDDEMIDEARQRALRQAGLAGPVLCSTARGYICDGKTFPEAPLGLPVRSLTADVINWIAEPRYVESLSRLLDDVGFAPGLIAPRVVALAGAALSQSERDRGVAALCVSEEFTEVVVYRAGQLDDLFVVPLGIARLNTKLASVCGIPLDLVQRVDLKRMLESSIADPIVQRVRTIISAWSLSLMRAVRERIETLGPVWQLGAGIVIADSGRALPSLAQTASRVIGVSARVAMAEPAIAGTTRGEPLAAQGLIPLQWRLRVGVDQSLATPMFSDPNVGADERDDRRGIGPVIGRWLREFVPADHAP
jgi:cell division ATPase FtsA